MAEAFDLFNTPQFVDFREDADDFEDSRDAYFDIAHESRQQDTRHSECNSFYSPVLFSSDTVNYNELDPLETSYDKPYTTNLRKSMSDGNLVLLHEEEFTSYLDDIGENIKKLNVNQNAELTTQPPSNQKKIYSYKSSAASSATNTFREKGSQDYLNKLAQPKRYPLVENLKQGNNGKFNSMAEAINKFQNRTLVRFRSKPNLSQNPGSQALYRFKIKAHPVNKKILHGPLKPTVPVEKKALTKPQPFNLTSVQPKKPSTENLHLQFKARPPTVLYKEPFIPVKQEKPLTKLAPFSLSTELRAQEREKYKREKREKEEKLQYLKRLQEEERLRQEQKEIAKLRKELEYKAQPIKKYKKVIVQPSNKLTEPKSPNFQTDILRKMNNKENNPNNFNIFV